MSKPSCAFAVLFSISFLMGACGNGADTAGGGLSRTGGTTVPGGSTSAGTSGTGGTTVAPFAITSGASVLVPSSTRVAVTYYSAASNPGFYYPLRAPEGAECQPEAQNYTLDLINRQLWWDDCSVVGDSQIAANYQREVGSTCLSSSEFEGALAVLSLVHVTGKGQCLEYSGYFPATIHMTMSSPAGSQLYGDEKSCGVAVGSESLSNFEQVLASLANGASGVDNSTGSCDISAPPPLLDGV